MNEHNIGFYGHDLSAYKTACLTAPCPLHNKPLCTKTLKYDTKAHAHINIRVTTMAPYTFIQKVKNE